MEVVDVLVGEVVPRCSAMKMRESRPTAVMDSERPRIESAPREW